MAKSCFSPPWFYNLLVVFYLIAATATATSSINNEDRKVHIVYMGSLPTESQYSPSSHHTTILQDVIQTSSVSDVLVRSYKRSFNGFAAKLTDEEIEKLSRRSDVVSIFPSRTLQLQTTRSWDFMGLTDNINRNFFVESDLIVGVLDSGIYPLSESFNGYTFNEPPIKWKGKCAGGLNFTCNNKIIGARYYNEQDNSAMDTAGHGTHTAATAASVRVENASYFGIASGLARGGVPSSRIAVYKVCGKHCEESDILAAFDDAISDGVDILTLSLGSKLASKITYDSVAIGSFHAMEKGILTMQSAGNTGSNRSTISSVAPWLFSVAASNMDRRVVDQVVLGNGKKLVGNAINSFTLNETSFPLILGADATSTCSKSDAEICDSTCLDSKLVKGKIVVCKSIYRRVGPLESSPTVGIQEALRAGALGAIVLGIKLTDYSTVVPFPATFLKIEEFESLVSYINSTKNPQATILKSEAINVTPAPVVASFSSRGPNSIVPEILKPDISAPGVDILAAYSQVAPPSKFPQDPRPFVRFNILSGTSMSCPHVAGAAAYVKTLHTDWSPSAIKSALMTTAWPMSNTQQSADYEFAYGSGHVDPVKAIDPGLVYETTKDDYVKMLCSMGYNATTLRLISGDKNSTCPQGPVGSPKDLNYPSMTAFLNSTSDAFEVKFSRTVTNVGGKTSVYNSKVTSSNSDVVITVEPNVLSFESVGEKKAFIVTVIGKNGLKSMMSGSLVWSDGTHNARSPIVVYTSQDA